MEFLIGGLAGAGATLFSNPMDVVKTRMQLQGEMRARTEHTPRYRNMLHSLYVIARTDGVCAMQKGLVPAVLLGFTMNSVRLGAYHIAEVKGLTKNKGGDINMLKATFWSSMTGILSGVVSNPAQVVKTRMQAAAHPSIAVGMQHSYKGTIDGFITIYKMDGVKGYFAGINATCWRLGVGGAIQLTSFSIAKEAIFNYGMFHESPFLLAFAASALSGLVTTVTTSPIEVTTVRLYNQGSLSSGSQLYTGFFDCLRKTYSKEGIHGLYKGLGPFYMRLAPHTTLSLVIWDLLNNVLLNNKNL